MQFNYLKVLEFYVEINIKRSYINAYVQDVVMKKL